MKYFMMTRGFDKRLIRGFVFKNQGLFFSVNATNHFFKKNSKHI